MSHTEQKITGAIYCRVSTREQAEEGYSIGEQERLIREYCMKQGYEVYKVFSDAGISGKDIAHRPAIQELLKEAAEKKFDIVMSWKINRLSRELEDAIKIVNTLDRYGIAYRSYSEPFESDIPAGKMQFQMMALVGEFERNTIAQNVKMGMKAKARAGEWCGGIAPLGYHWVPMEGTEDFRNYPQGVKAYAATTGSGKTVPQIMLQGNRVRKWGFEAGCSMRVECFPNKLVILKE